MKVEHRKLQALQEKPVVPAPFEEIVRSIYVSFKPPKLPKHLSNDFISCDCDTEGQNKKLEIECYRKQCRKNSCIERRAFPKVEVKSAGIKGFGLFSMQNITRGVIIGEYIGEIIDAEEVAKRLEENKSFYAIQLTSRQFIDATFKGSKMRFVNHSCDPNCESETWFVGSEKRVVLTSIRDIKKGEEICFNYRFEDWGEMRQRCYCGTLKCTGWMDGNK